MSRNLHAVASEGDEYPRDLSGFPWYKWFPAKFNLSEDAAPLSLAEEGALRRLLDHQWINGSIPSEIEKLASICKRVAHSEMQTIWIRVKPFFEPDPRDANRAINLDLWQQMKEVSRASERQSNFGRTGARKRWAKHHDPNREAMNGPMPSDAREDIEKKTTTVGRGQPTKGEAMMVFAELREARVLVSPPQGVSRYVIAPTSLVAFDARAKSAVVGIGGLHIIANTPEDKLTILRAQFAEMFLSWSKPAASEGLRAD